MTAALREACADAATWLPRAAALTAIPDTDGTARHTQPASRPPWNQAAAEITYGMAEDILRTERGLRAEVTGHPGRYRRSYAATGAAIRGIADLGAGASRTGAQDAARRLSWWVTVIRQLAAIDEEPKWERIRPGPDGTAPVCPFCGCCTLRVAVRSGMVVCVLPGCADTDGNAPRGRMEVGRVSSQPCVVWGDGTVQAAP